MDEPEPQPNQVPPRRRNTSTVWEHFDEVLLDQDGVEVVKARCKWPGCTLHLFVDRAGAIGHLRRHHEAHVKRSLREAQDGGGSGVDDF